MTSSSRDTTRTLDHHVMRAQFLSHLSLSLHHLYLSYEEEEEEADHYVMLRRTAVKRVYLSLYNDQHTI